VSRLGTFASETIARVSTYSLIGL